MHVLIKWSKTMQTRNMVKILKLPSLGSNPLCPVNAIKNLLAITPGSKNQPMFQYKTLKGWVPLTDTQVRHHFHLILKRLNLHTSNLTFHAFRRSGATYAFNSNVELQHIQRHLDVGMRLEIHHTWPQCCWSSLPCLQKTPLPTHYFLAGVWGLSPHLHVQQRILYCHYNFNSNI